MIFQDWRVQFKRLEKMEGNVGVIIVTSLIRKKFTEWRKQCKSKLAQ